MAFNAARTFAAAVNLVDVSLRKLASEFDDLVPQWVKDDFNRLFSVKIRFENHMYGVINGLCVCAYPPMDEFMVSPQGLVRDVPLRSGIPSIVALDNSIGSGDDLLTSPRQEDSFEQPSQFSELDTSALEVPDMDFPFNYDLFLPPHDSENHGLSDFTVPDVSDTSFDPSDVSSDPIDGYPVVSGTRKGHEKKMSIIDYVVYKRVNQVDSHGQSQHTWAIVAVVELKRDGVTELQYERQLVRYMRATAARQNAAKDMFRHGRPTVQGILVTNEKIIRRNLKSHEAYAEVVIGDSIPFDADGGFELWKLLRENARQWSTPTVEV